MPGPQPAGQIPVFSTTAVLTNAEFKALPTTAFELVPAPGAGKIIRWINASLVLDNSAGAYVMPDGAFLQLVYLSSPSRFEASGLVAIQGPGLVPGVYSSPIPALASFNDAEGYLTWTPTDIGSLIQNVGIGIADIYNGVIDYTGGNAANTLSVNLLYTIVDA